MVSKYLLLLFCPWIIYTQVILDCQEQINISYDQHYYSIGYPSHTLDCPVLSYVLFKVFSVNVVCIEDSMVVQFKSNDSSMFVSFVQSLPLDYATDQIMCFQQLISLANFNQSLTQTEVEYYSGIFITLAINGTLQYYGQLIQEQIDGQSSSLDKMQYGISDLQENITVTILTLAQSTTQATQAIQSNLITFQQSISQMYDAIMAQQMNNSTNTTDFSAFKQDFEQKISYLNSSIALLGSRIAQLVDTDDSEKTDFINFGTKIDSLSFMQTHELFQISKSLKTGFIVISIMFLTVQFLFLLVGMCCFRKMLNKKLQLLLAAKKKEQSISSVPDSQFTNIFDPDNNSRQYSVPKKKVRRFVKNSSQFND